MATSDRDYLTGEACEQKDAPDLIALVGRRADELSRRLDRGRVMLDNEQEEMRRVELQAQYNYMNLAHNKLRAILDILNLEV